MPFDILYNNIPNDQRIKAINSDIKSYLRSHFWEEEVDLPKKIRVYVKNKAIKDTLEQIQIFKGQNLNFVTRVIKLMIATLLVVLASSQLFEKDTLSGKLKAIRELTEEPVATLFKEICLEEFKKNEEFSFCTEYQLLILGILYKILINISKNDRYFENKEKKIRKQTDMRCMNSSQRWQIRILIAENLKKGKSIRFISKILLVDKDTVLAVKKKLDEDPNLDYEELRDKKRGPEQEEYNKISKEAFLKLAKAIIEDTPKKYGIDCATWSAYAILLFLKKECEITITLRYLYYFLARKGIHSKFAARVHFRQDKKAVKDFTERRYLQICLRALEENRLLLFADECNTCRGESHRGFGMPGMRTHNSYAPDVRTVNVSILTFMSPEGYFKSYTIDGAFTSAQFIQCLKALSRANPGKKFLIILDNCKVHKSEEVNNWLAELASAQDDTFVFEWLPPYSPEINPIEFYNQDYKAYLRKKASRDGKDVIMHFKGRNTRIS